MPHDPRRERLSPRRRAARGAAAVGAVTLGTLALALACGAPAAGCARRAPADAARRSDAARAVTARPDAADQRPQGHGGSGHVGREVELTVLFTTDEHGWLLPHDEDGVSWGGASRLFARLREAEQHCSPGVLAVSEGDDPCADAHTILLSGGDNFTGPAISSHFRGASMARAMGRLGYVASALGNHELDFDRAAFDDNRRVSRMTYLAANLTREDGSPSELAQPFVVVRRAGVDVGIIGLALPDTPRVALASRFAGLRFDDAEETLARVVPLVWQAGADVVLVLAHECADRVVPMLERHPQWALSLVGTGHCHELVDRLAAGTLVMSPGWRLDRYARVALRVEPELEGPRRAKLVARSIVEVRAESGAASTDGDPQLDSWLEGWRQEVTRALGEVVAISQSGMARESDEIAGWVLRSWLEQIEADVAVTTRGSIRQELPPGPVTVETIQSILPFENELVVASVPGGVLREMAARPGTRMVGVVRQADGRVAQTMPLEFEPKKRYRVVTTDFLYGGGDDCPFRQADPNARFTGVHWRAPVVSWTRALATSASRPLESAVRASLGSSPSR